MQIREYMTRPATFCHPETTLAEIARMMRDHDIGAVPVAENDRLIGMVTDRDVVIRGLAAEKAASEPLARDVMSDPILYCFDDQPPPEVLENMGELKVRRLPVVDREKQLVGMVSLGDLAAGCAPATVGRTEADVTQPAAAS